jgi:hypothetical protein
MEEWMIGRMHSSTYPSNSSGAGRFAYNLRLPRSPTRPHADTPTRPFGDCGSAALWNLWFIRIANFRLNGIQMLFCVQHAETTGLHIKEAPENLSKIIRILVATGHCDFVDVH